MRRNTKVAFAIASSVVVLTTASLAAAGDMDPTPERLITQPAGAPSGACPALGGSNCPNNVAWANMMSELGMAIAPSAFHPARTTGLGGFALSLEATYTHINADASAGGLQYWHVGTRGTTNPNNGQYSTSNTSPDSLIQVYTLKARKGLAYGFEITGALGYVANTSLWVGGGDIHWAILEGYRTGFLGYLPDVAAGAGVRTLGGANQFYLTTLGIDAQISKPIVLDDSAVLTPYVGAQWVKIYADSAVVDLAPNADPLQQCGYEGANVPGNPYGMAPYDGKPVCKNKVTAPNGVGVVDNNAAFNNLTTFQRARIQRWRGIAGINYRFDVLWLAGQFAIDLMDPGTENDASIGLTGAKQWTTSFEAGVYF